MTWLLIMKRNPSKLRKALVCKDVLDIFVVVVKFPRTVRYSYMPSSVPILFSAITPIPEVPYACTYTEICNVFNLKLASNNGQNQYLSAMEESCTKHLIAAADLQTRSQTFWSASRDFHSDLELIPFSVSQCFPIKTAQQKAT